MEQTYLENSGRCMEEDTMIHQSKDTTPYRLVLKSLWPTSFTTWSVLFLGHGEAILCNVPELRDATKIDLCIVCQCDNNVSPFSKQAGNRLDILDDCISKIPAVRASEAGDDCDSEIGESVSQEHCPENCCYCEWHPEECETEDEIGHKVSVMGASVEEHFLLVSLCWCR